MFVCIDSTDEYFYTIGEFPMSRRTSRLFGDRCDMCKPYTPHTQI
jgi:hypothetical protein